MILSTLLLASPFLIQEPGHDVPITHTGAQAIQAFEEWSADLPKDLPYPVQMFMDLEMGMNIPDANMDMAMSMKMYSLMDNAQTLRVWGDLEAHSMDGGPTFGLEASFEVGVDEAGLRMTFEDGGFLRDNLDVEIPSGFTLSRDRLGKVADMYLVLFESMPTFYGEKMLDTFKSIKGPGELMHPALWSRYMSYTEGWEISGWGEKNGVARIELVLDFSVMEGALQGEESPFDLKSMEDMEYSMLVSSRTGEILDWNMDLNLPMTESFGGEEGGGMNMKMHMKTVPVSENAPSILMPAEGVMDLNPHFDNFLPMLEVMMEMAGEQMKQQQGELESTDDFEF